MKIFKQERQTNNISITVENDRAKHTKAKSTNHHSNTNRSSNYNSAPLRKPKTTNATHHNGFKAETSNKTEHYRKSTPPKAAKTAETSSDSVHLPEQRELTAGEASLTRFWLPSNRLFINYLIF